MSDSIKLAIQGMSCMHCVGRVDKTLKEQAGVSEVKVDLDAGSAVITGTDLDGAALAKAVTEAGYPAQVD